MLFTGWEVRIEKYFVEVSKTARGRRPRDVFETETKYFSIRTDLNDKSNQIKSQDRLGFRPLTNEKKIKTSIFSHE